MTENYALLRSIEEGYHYKLCVEYELDQVCNPVKVDVRGSVPNIEPRRNVIELESYMQTTYLYRARLRSSSSGGLGGAK